MLDSLVKWGLGIPKTDCDGGDDEDVRGFGGVALTILALQRNGLQFCANVDGGGGRSAGRGFWLSVVVVSDIIVLII